MALQDKYRELITEAQKKGVQNLQVREQGNVLYIDGDVPTHEAKIQLWDVYNKIDPDYRSGELVLNLNNKGNVSDEYEVKRGDNLSKIGKQFGVSWQEIFEANKDQIKNPDLIQPGWRLKIPMKP
ncbi:MAG TPA: LysM peptidoglycan-binding domain-containing protein [Flavitalea sp.]|nr:LysM peptidoglycan-binding domain-containing protein [Flavitalea sp.]